MNPNMKYHNMCRTFQQQCLDNKTQMHCYCPAIGDCQVFQYELWLPLNTLNPSARDANATYFLRVTAGNNAQLSTTKDVEFMIEFTPGKLTHMHASCIP